MKEINKIKITISGSFRKHFDVLLESIKILQDAGYDVTSPQKSRITNIGHEFAVLESDQSLRYEEIQRKHFQAISEADALYVVNPHGYIGLSTAMEIGWALSRDIPVLIMHKPADLIFSDLCILCPTVEQIRIILDNRKKIKKNVYLSRSSSLHEIQEYIAEVVRERGFAEESTRDILLLLVEEVGELAKSVRKQIGLKTDSSSLNKNVSHELADIMIYLVDLANNCNIDLHSALIEKENINKKRIWVKNNRETYNG